MQRRHFMKSIAGAGVASLLAWPLAVRAQQLNQIRRIGVIMGFAQEDEVWQAYLATFRQRLQDFGWIEGRNI